MRKEFIGKLNIIRNQRWLCATGLFLFVLLIFVFYDFHWGSVKEEEKSFNIKQIELEKEFTQRTKAQ